jgi:hypothetical protein
LAIGYIPHWWALLTAIEHVQRVTGTDFAAAAKALVVAMREDAVTCRLRGRPDTSSLIPPERWYSATIESDGSVLFDEASPNPRHAPERQHIEVWREDVLRWWWAEATETPSAQQETKDRPAPNTAPQPTRCGRKHGSGQIDDELALREMLDNLATGKCPSVYAAAKAVAARGEPRHSTDADIKRRYRKFRDRWGTEPAAGKTWADVAHQLHRN